MKLMIMPAILKIARFLFWRTSGVSLLLIICRCSSFSCTILSKPVVCSSLASRSLLSRMSLLVSDSKQAGLVLRHRTIEKCGCLASRRMARFADNLTGSSIILISVGDGHDQEPEVQMIGTIRRVSNAGLRTIWGPESWSILGLV